MLPALALVLALAPPHRSVLPLDSGWQITTGDPADAASDWRPIAVPASWESVLGDDFDGVANYRVAFALPADFGGERVVLEFDGAATEAHVWLNGELVGTHLGAWTPFRFDVTSLARRGGDNELLVMLDEKVGHDTQGFLPVIAPHFGGLWQPVRVLGLAATFLDDLAILAVGDLGRSVATLEVPVVGDGSGCSIAVAIDCAGGEPVRATLAPGVRAEVEVPCARPFEVGAPNLHPVRFELLDSSGTTLDAFATRIGFRTLDADGKKLKLNGHPLQVRGMLEWGYFPPLLAPYVDDEAFRTVLDEAKRRGFNLIKFCLWVPPRHLLRLVDEAGLLAWQEYPTWHPRFDAEHHAALAQEFEEFYAHVRNHPSVLFHSLTCETGPSASLEVIQDLYDRAKRAIPGALVEDDSSWIEWNRVNDFWDDHPYGNNDTWPEVLAGLDRYVDEHDPKPLLLGEAIAADTWLDRKALKEAAALRRWWTPIVYRDQERWEERMRGRFGAACIERLRDDSLRFALAQRKDQVEAFRLIVPDGGYVMSVARDFRTAQMGLADGAGRWKWQPVEMTSFQRDTVLALAPRTPRSFASGAKVALPLFAAHYGRSALPAGRAKWAAAGVAMEVLDHGALEPGTATELGTIAFQAPAVERPTLLRLLVALGTVENRFDLWIVPEPPAVGGDGVRVVRALDEALLQELEDGARVLLLASDEPRSFVRVSTWLLKGAPWFPPHPLAADVPPEFLLDLVPKDLHPAGLLPMADLLEHVAPIALFWDTHDSERVKDWGLAWETRVGKGRLLVSALPADGSAAARWLAARLRRQLAAGEPPAAALPADLVAAIRDRLSAATIDLTALEWQFRPEPDPGAAPGAAAPFTPIRIGRSWEGQGYPNLDGWATYRLDVDVPREWEGEPLHLNLEGADDHFEVYFDGTKCGEGGDVANRRTAFDERSTHRLAARASAGPHQLEVRVFDWYGAGGLHRPASLSTRPLGRAAEFLRGR